MKERQFVFQSLFFDMNLNSIERQSHINKSNNKLSSLHRQKQNQIEKDVSLVNKNISVSSDRVYSLYQNYYLNNYKNFILLNKKEEGNAASSRFSNKAQPDIQGTKPIKEINLKKDSSPIMRTRPYPNSPKDLMKNHIKPNWKKQVKKARLSNEFLSNKMKNIQICSLTESIPNLKEEKEEAKYRSYEMNDFYFKQKPKPFKCK